jgi:hypothetical protein
VVVRQCTSGSCFPSQDLDLQVAISVRGKRVSEREPRTMEDAVVIVVSKPDSAVVVTAGGARVAHGHSYSYNSPVL